MHTIINLNGVHIPANKFIHPCASPIWYDLALLHIFFKNLPQQSLFPDVMQ